MRDSRRVLWDTILGLAQPSTRNIQILARCLVLGIDSKRIAKTSDRFHVSALFHQCYPQKIVGIVKFRRHNNSLVTMGDHVVKPAQVKKR